MSQEECKLELGPVNSQPSERVAQLEVAYQTGNYATTDTPLDERQNRPLVFTMAEFATKYGLSTEEKT